MAEKQSPNQIRRIEELQGYVRTVDHVKKLVAELESNRAAKPKIVDGICGNIARALSHEACLRRWHGKVGAEDEVLVDRPGRGYGDDYSPWLVDAPVGELVRVRGAAVSEEGILAA